MACRSGAAARSDAAMVSGDRGRLTAIHSCSRTMSTPATSSVTPCSTWRRVLTSRNQKRPSGSSRNSTVAALAEARHGHGPDGASWSSRRWSGSSPGAGDSSTSFWWRRWASSHVPRARRCGRRRRRSAGPRRGARAGSRAPGRQRRRRTRPAPRPIRRPGRGQLVRLSDATHPAAATAGSRLHEQQEPDRRRFGHDRRDVIGPIDGCGSVSRGRSGRRRRRRPAPRACRRGCDRRAARPDRRQAGILDGSREGRALGKKP